MTAHATTTTPSAVTVVEKTLIRLGALVGGAVLLAHAAGGNPVVLIPGMLLYGAVLGVIVWRAKGASAAPAPVARLYSAGLGGTMGAYALVLALDVNPGLSTGTAIMAAMLTMLPAFLAAHRISRFTA